MGLKALLVLLILVAVQTQSCNLKNCDECDPTSAVISGSYSQCLTCHGWYESSWDTYLCVLSARLIILTIACGLLFFAILICSIFKIQEYRAKYTERPTNIESMDLDTP